MKSAKDYPLSELPIECMECYSEYEGVRDVCPVCGEEFDRIELIRQVNLGREVLQSRINANKPKFEDIVSGGCGIGCLGIIVLMIIVGIFG